jgi:16S rRNA (guanine527-N7)-methyltransferase
VKAAETTLEKGIEALCQSNDDIERLIACRREKILSLLNRYINEIQLFNDAYGLVGTNDTEELVIRHILDSLAPLGIIFRLVNKTSTPKIADAGSGAGLPGIPLAIAMPDCEFTLIERMGRRAGFLFNTKAILGLSNISIEENQIEKNGGKFDLITFRAFKPLEPKLLKTLFSICTQNGIIAAYKGKLEKIEQEINHIKSNSCKWEIIPCNVPFLEEERNLLVISEIQQC